METKARHTIIGAFAVLVLACALAFLYWIGSSGTSKDTKDFYVIFQGSVSGLSEGGSVLFNGLKVGEVRALGLNPGKPTEIRALIKINRLTPVHQDTRAILNFQGLTGVASIELSGGTSTAPMLKNGSDGSPATLYADRTFLQNISDRAQETVTRVNSVLIKLDDLVAAIDPEDVKTLTRALGKEGPGMVKDTAETMRKLNALSDKLDIIATQLAGDKKQKGLIAEAKDTIVSIRKNGTVLLQDSRSAVQSADKLLQSLEREPQQVIWGKSKFQD